MGIRAYVTDDAGRRGRRAIETAVADVVGDVVDAVTQTLAPVADNDNKSDAGGEEDVETREDSAASVEHDRHAGAAAHAR